MPSTVRTRTASLARLGAACAVGAAVTGSAAVAPAPTSAASAAAASAASASAAATASPAASASAPVRAVTAPAASAAAPRAATSIATPTAVPVVSTRGLFAGARYAPGAGSRPSTGGVRLATTGRGPLRGQVVVVDPGHAGVSVRRIDNRPVPDGAGGRKACNTSGTASTRGYPEHAHNWAVATRLAAILKAQGATVVLTRPDDAGVGPCVDERAAIGNRARANLVVSVHADGSAASNRGFHVIRSTRMAGGVAVTNRSSRAARTVRDAFARGTGLPRSTYVGSGTAITPRRDIAGLNLSRVPAVMVEAGNMRHRSEARLLARPAFHDKEAIALARGVRAALGR